MEPIAPTAAFSPTTELWALRLLLRQGLLRRQVTAQPSGDTDAAAALDACMRRVPGLPRPRRLASLAALARSGLRST